MVIIIEFSSQISKGIQSLLLFRSKERQIITKLSQGSRQMKKTELVGNYVKLGTKYIEMTQPPRQKVGNNNFFLNTNFSC